MPSFLIVGAGQAGLQLAFGLVQDGHDVTVVSNRIPDDIRNGRVMSSQCMFDAALAHERELGIDFWPEECPDVDGISLAVPAPDGGKTIDWAARLERPAQSVDQRVKMPIWMEELERRGGKLVFHDATIPDLEAYARDHDLVIVAAGKGEVAQLFERDPSRSPYTRTAARPRAHLRNRDDAASRLLGRRVQPDSRRLASTSSFRRSPSAGPCEIMVFEGVPGGPMDCWGDVTTADEHLAKSKWILETFLPWEAERCRSIDAHRRQRHPRRPVRTNRTQAGRPAAVGRGRPGTRRHGRPQRSDHRTGLEQREQGRRVLPGEHPGARRRAV